MTQVTKRLTDIKAVIIPILKQHNAIRAGLFGSAVKGEMKPDSDVDILVELPPTISLLEFVGLKLELEKALGRPVDLVEYSTIHPRLKEEILKEEIALMKQDSRLFVQDILTAFSKLRNIHRV